jgi:hypothetical protein
LAAVLGASEADVARWLDAADAEVPEDILDAVEEQQELLYEAANAMTGMYRERFGEPFALASEGEAAAAPAEKDGEAGEAGAEATIEPTLIEVPLLKSQDEYHTVFAVTAGSAAITYGTYNCVMCAIAKNLLDAGYRVAFTGVRPDVPLLSLEAHGLRREA